MKLTPSRGAERSVGFFIPVACREEILGDLRERYRSPGQYALEALRTVPWVIASRIRRTSDLLVRLLEAVVFYSCSLGLVWYTRRTFFVDPWAFVELAQPALLGLAVLTLADAYSKPRARPDSRRITHSVLAAFAWMLSQIAVCGADPQWTVPITFVICSMTLELLHIGISTSADQLKGVNAPADWLRSQPVAIPPAAARILKIAAAVFAAIVLYQLSRTG